MSAYTQFFLSTSSSVVQLECLEISHPDMTRAYYIVRNHADGVTAKVDGLNKRFEYYPLKVTRSGSRSDLDHGIRVDIGDLGLVWPQELDAIAAGGRFSTKPKVRYWTFRSDDLNTPLFGPLTLEMVSFSFSKDGASFEAKAPQLNYGQTGEAYVIERFPMLRGFI